MLRVLWWKVNLGASCANLGDGLYVPGPGTASREALGVVVDPLSDVPRASVPSFGGT
jgi:hypothetical protein